MDAYRAKWYKYNIYDILQHCKKYQCENTPQCEARIVQDVVFFSNSHYDLE